MGDEVHALKPGGNFTSVMQLDRDLLDNILERAAVLKRIDRLDYPTSLTGCLVAILFFQPSTRTRFSFEAAVARLGGQTIGFGSPEGTRSGGGWVESLADTARVMSSYADCAVVRHGDVSGVREFARHASIPVVSAGAGIGEGAEHPTQALLDVVTIKETHGKLDGLRILHIGGLGLRTVPSLIKLLRFFPKSYHVLYAAEIDKHIERSADEYRNLGINVVVTNILDDELRVSDVIYHHGISEDPKSPIDDRIVLNRSRLKHIGENSIIMHSLPRVGELSTDVDELAQAAYFRQAPNGVPGV